MEIFSLVEFFELHVHCLSLLLVGLHRKIFFIPFSNEIFEFLLDFQMRKPLLQAADLMLKKLRQVIRDLLIGIKSKYMLGRVEADLKLFPQTIFFWRTVFVKRNLEHWLNDEW